LNQEKRRFRRHLRRPIPINTLAPNILTVLALCSGLTSMRFALQEHWQLAVAAILLAGVLDGLDGRLARLLKGASKFGAELDSLSDMVCFGVAPAVTLYLWELQNAGGIGWIAVLAFAVCCGLRLARFNTALDDPDRPAWSGNFFTGVAAPVGASLALLPMALAFQIGDEYIRTPFIIVPWTLFLAAMMVSKVPTYSFKKLRVRRDMVLPVLLIIGFAFGALVTFPWITLTVIGLLYLSTFLFSFRAHARYRRGWQAGGGAPLMVADEDDEIEDADADEHTDADTPK
jgi:CDP-diacylglycerol--serine O-phosphatidyltransferase